MLADYPISQNSLSEWRRSSRFFLIALIFHGAILFYPMKFALGNIDVPPPGNLQVTLLEPAAPLPPSALPIPTAVPHKPKAAAVRQEKTLSTPRKIIAVTAPAVTNTPTVATPPPIAAENIAAPMAVTAAATAVPSSNVGSALTAARFDAAYLQNPRPNYPGLSRRLGEEGKVLLKVRVTANGLAATVDLEKSSNFERLDEAAKEAVAHWRFIPAKRGDQAIESSVIVPIVFRLDN